MDDSHPNADTVPAQRAFGSRGCLGLSSLSAGLLAGVVVVLVFCVGLPIWHTSVWQVCDFDLPENAGKLTFRQIGIHPFLAEYSREVVLSRAKGMGAVHPLPWNTGGRTYVNVYWLKSGAREFVRLDDAYGEYLLDVDNDQMYLVVRAAGRAFAARFQSENPRVMREMCNNDPATIQVEVDGRTAAPLDSLTADSTGRYVGALSGATGPLRFRPAAECPERRIDKN